MLTNLKLKIQMEKTYQTIMARLSVSLNPSGNLSAWYIERSVCQGCQTLWERVTVWYTLIFSATAGMNFPQCISADVEKYSLPPANDAALHTHIPLQFIQRYIWCVNTTCKNWLTHIQIITHVDHGQSESMEADSSDKVIVILKTNTHRAIGLVLILNTNV